jgi:hypothetical protein
MCKKVFNLFIAIVAIKETLGAYVLMAANVQQGIKRDVSKFIQ